MKVSIRRSGGFAGLQTKSFVDSSDLSNEEADRLSELVHRVLPLSQTNTVVFDDFEYLIEIELDNTHHKTSVYHSNASEELHQLIEFVFAKS